MVKKIQLSPVYKMDICKNHIPVGPSYQLTSIKTIFKNVKQQAMS